MMDERRGIIETTLFNTATDFNLNLLWNRKIERTYPPVSRVIPCTGAPYII